MFMGNAKGYICAFLGATLWGLSGVCSDFLLSGYAITPLQLTMMRLIVAAVLFGGVALVRRPQALRSMIADGATRRGLLVFGVALFLCQGTYILAIGATNAGTATVMQSLNIVFIPIFTWLLRRAGLRRTHVVGAVLAFASVFFIATQGDPKTLSLPLMGLVWGLACGFSETFYVMAPVKLFQRWGSFTSTALGMCIGAVIGIVVNVAASAVAGDMSTVALPQLDAGGWVALLIVCVVGTFVAFALFLKGVASVGPVATSLLGAMEPLSAAILSALWLGTAFSGWDWAGLVLMLCTIVLVALPQRAEKSR